MLLCLNRKFFKEKNLQKIKLIMKFSSFLLFVMLLNAMATSVQGQNETIRIQKKNVIVREVLKEIESKSNYRFFFSDDFADIYKVVSIDVESDDITELLSGLFQKSTVTFKVLDNNIVVITPINAVRQGILISGIVTDTEGSPLPGVNVVIKDSRQGTVTNANGAYSISVPDENATLVFSSLGYASQEILVGNQSAINVTLSEDAREIEEVVVTALGI